MKGLLLKDYYMMRDSSFIMILIMAILGVVLAVLSSPWYLLVIATSSLSMAAVTTISNDKITQWDKFSSTLPVSRAQIISSKYYMYVFLAILGIVLGAIVSISVLVLKQSFDADSLIMYSCLAIIISLLPGSVNIPLSYLLEAEKSVVALILSYVVTASAFTGLRFLLSYFINMEENMLLVYGIVAVFSVLAYLFSWLLCPKMISRKDM